MPSAVWFVVGVAVGVALEVKTRYVTKMRPAMVIDTDPDAPSKLNFSDLTLVGSNYDRR